MISRYDRDDLVNTGRLRRAMSVLAAVAVVLAAVGLAYWVGTLQSPDLDEYERDVLDYSECRGQPFDQTMRDMFTGDITIEEMRAEVDGSCGR